MANRIAGNILAYDKATGTGTDADPWIPQVLTTKPGIVITPTITVSATPDYTSGDSLGGKITLPNAVRATGGMSKLVSVNIIDSANQKPAGTILFFNADPAAATLTDNTAFALSTDVLKVVASVVIAAADYVTIDSVAFLTYGNINKIVQAAATSLYAAFVITTASNLAATTDIQIAFGFEYIN
jgi:hypothetical protein